MQTLPTDKRMRISVSGVVQGVGFRPFVHNLADTLSLSGFVRNDNSKVVVEVQGPLPSLECFLNQLREQVPPLASIDHIDCMMVDLEYNLQQTFEIRVSQATSILEDRFVPPDSGTCNQCLDELFDSTNRRFRYPFINCTNCGPRFTIISSLPYDRQSTTMAHFIMCRLCQQEYDNPKDRRFHAQPNACWHCGPILTLFEADHDNDTINGDSVMARALECLGNGRILAVKGLGGFHLMCDAQRSAAVETLRQRKRRPKKPFAVMMKDIYMVRQYCHCSDLEETELLSQRRPILLLELKVQARLSTQIAPGITRLGVMLPYTPLHHLLLNGFDGPLVATSGNFSDEPIAIANKEAFLRLKNIADVFVTHNRAIKSRYDDSIVQFVDREKTTLRRGRALAPLPVTMPFRSTMNVLAFGGQLKNTVCFIQNNKAFVSQHIGDLDNLETLEHLEETLDTYIDLFKFTPELIAHDCHPDYLSTDAALKFAEKHKVKSIAVQHHHAHIVSCMVENQVTESVIGVAFDGLGYGFDETLWGGEFLQASLFECKRLAFLEPVPLPGGSQAIRQPWRMALSYITESPSPDSFKTFLDTLAAEYGQHSISLVQNQIRRRLNSPLTSSCGRLFDAMSALLSICHVQEYEGQAAMELESLATRAETKTGSYSFQLAGDHLPFPINTSGILEEAYRDFMDGSSRSDVAYKFHLTLAKVVLDVCMRLRQSSGLNTVCLSGGVFQNALLLSLVKQMLSDAGFKPLWQREFPANDGGLSLGQAAIALARVGAFNT